MKKYFSVKILFTLAICFIAFSAMAQGTWPMSDYAYASIDRGKILLKGNSYDQENAKAMISENVRLIHFFMRENEKENQQYQEKLNGVPLQNGPLPPANIAQYYNDKLSGAASAFHNGSLDFGIGLEFVGKGLKDEFTDQDGNTTTEKVMIWYLELLPTARYNWFLKSAIFSVAAGPYLGYALGGNDKFEGQKTKLTFGDNGDFTRTDLGLQLHLNYQPYSTPFSIGIFTEIGLKNIAPGPGSDNGDKNKTQTFGLEIGYAFR